MLDWSSSDRLLTTACFTAEGEGLILFSVCSGVQLMGCISGMQSSEFGDERPIWACQFSPSGAELATAAWSGLVKVWAVPACQKTRTIKAHDNRITGRCSNADICLGRPEDRNHQSL